MRKVKRLLKGSGGFTLIELIVVIAIMAFLVAMIAPRVAGFGKTAKKSVCQSSQVRLADAVDRYLQDHPGQLPDKLINPITVVGSTYKVPSIEDNNPDNGRGVLGMRNQYMHFYVHQLSGAEAKELKRMGIKKIYNLNYNKTVAPDLQGDPATDPFMHEVSVAKDVYVLMIGAGFADGSWAHASDGSFFQAPPDLMYRIVMGVGPDSTLVTDEYIHRAAICPEGTVAGQQRYLYTNYGIVLPRLESTVTATGAREIPAGKDTVVATAYDDLRETNLGQTKTVNLKVAQDSWEVLACRPGGVTLPTDGVAPYWWVKWE